MLIVLVLVERPHLHEQFNEGRAVAAATRGNVSRNNEARSRGGKTSSLKRRMKWRAATNVVGTNLFPSQTVRRQGRRRVAGAAAARGYVSRNSEGPRGWNIGSHRGACGKLKLF
jgi:hypothetical protein